MEHRCGRRFSTDLPVRMIALPAAIGAGHVLNVSSTGAFIQTSLVLPVLTLVYLETPGGLRRERLSERHAAYVVRQCVTGIGVEWFDVAPDWALIKAVEGDRDSAGELVQHPHNAPPGSHLHH